MILGFLPQFTDLILLGTKIHTVRVDNNKRWKPHKKIHFSTGIRTKNYTCFKQGYCISVQSFKLQKIDNRTFIWVDNRFLSIKESELFARNEGFNNFNDFCETWYKLHPEILFIGKIIHWTNFKY